MKTQNLIRIIGKECFGQLTVEEAHEIHDKLTTFINNNPLTETE